MERDDVRERVRALASGRWGEPATAVFLDEVRPGYRVAGRRRDGSVTGSLWGAMRVAVSGLVGGVVSVVLSVAGGEAVHVFGRQGVVTGKRNAQALGLVDAARQASEPWLVYSSSTVAVVDTGQEEPRVVWHAHRPDAPRVFLSRRRLTWPDGSEFRFHISTDESRALR